jgi:hypothetical protein
MTSNYKRKADDNTIIELNNIGLSLTGIAERLGVHHTTITYRLKALGIPAADTRRAFMEDVFEALSPSQKEWLVNQLGPGYSVKDFIRSLLIKEFVNRTASTSSA